MKLRGIVKIQILDESENLRFEIVQYNLIPDNTWVELLSWNSVANFFGSKSISISTDTTEPIASDFTIDGVIGTATTTIVEYLDTTEPPFGTIYAKIDPVGYTRTFDAVALTTLGASNDYGMGGSVSATAYAWLKLDTTCTQNENDFVNISYSIQFQLDIGDPFFNDKLVRDDFAKKMFATASGVDFEGSFRISYIQFPSLSFLNSSLNIEKLPYVSVSELSNDEIAFHIAGITSPRYTGVRVDDYFKWKFGFSAERDEHLGKIFNCLVQGKSNNNLEAYTAFNFDYDKEPFQTGFWHSSNSNKPFFDSDFVSNSQGYIYLSGTWSNRIPEFYIVRITQSGNETTAQYKFSVLKHAGFDGNTLNFRAAPILYRGVKIKDKYYGAEIQYNDVQKYSDSQIVQYEANGVTLLNIISGEHTSWDSTTSPALPVTQLRQIAVDVTNKRIYAACRVTGLWQINVLTNTIVQIKSNPCYGVDIGKSNNAYAVFNTGLFRSVNWTSAANFTYTGISDSNWSRVKFLKADPSHNDEKLALVAELGDSFNRIIWYDFVSQSATDGYVGNPSSGLLPSFPSCLECSEIGNNWFITLGNFDSPGAAALLRLEYGNTSTNFVGIPTQKQGNHPFYGNLYFTKVETYKDSVIARNGILGGSFEYFFPTGLIDSATLVHLGDGMLMLDAALKQILSYTEAQINYGWNGSAWIKDNPNSKTTHTTAQALINGLQIRFENSGNSPEFLVNEYFTEGINLGLLKDNATTVNFNTAWYSKSTYKGTVNQTIPGSATLTLPAASETFFRRIDNEDTKLLRFAIAGVPITHAWTDSTPPAPTEINVQTNGDVTFNSADIGKNFSGNYIWISV